MEINTFKGKAALVTGAASGKFCTRFSFYQHFSFAKDAKTYSNHINIDNPKAEKKQVGQNNRNI